MESILDLKDFEFLGANEQTHLVDAFSLIEVALSSDSDDTSDHDDTSNHNGAPNHHDYNENYNSISQQELNGIQWLFVTLSLICTSNPQLSP